MTCIILNLKRSSDNDICDTIQYDSDTIKYGSDNMIVELTEDTNTLLQKVKKEFGQPLLSDEEIIKDALKYYYVDIVQINRQKSKYPEIRKDKNI